MDGFRLDGKVALVTGAGQGIGKAVATGLARSGALVALTDLSTKAEAIAQVKNQIQALGQTAQAYEVDVREVGNIQQAVDRVVSDLGRLDILVNNAGVRVRRPSLDVTEEEWDWVMDVNLKGMFFCAQAAARHMLSQQSGRIINMASQLAISAQPERAAYSASKGGVASMTRALAVEWAKHGITVNTVAPGPTNTPMVGPLTPEVEKELAARSPIGRRLEPEEIVGAVLYLASPSASGVTGHMLLVDGGWTAW